MDESKGRGVLRYRESHSKRPGQGVTYSWDADDNQKSYRTNKNTDLTRSNEWFTSLVNVLREIFLPEGYPHTISDDYLAYQVWDTIQAFARCVRSVRNKKSTLICLNVLRSSISGSLATQAVLQGVGVGDETATPLAATITWLLRQGAGMASQIAFTWTQVGVQSSVYYTSIHRNVLREILY